MYIRLHVKNPFFLSDFNKKFNFLDISSKNTQIRNFVKIRPVGDESFYAHRQRDGRTDRHDEANRSVFETSRTRRKKQNILHTAPEPNTVPVLIEAAWMT